ncbi:MAG: GNAT family N-acetyltransferase [Actinobacteria bacterium]|nr:GNAT family N-acetyltransferase [Actinomycetota bacterium]
MPQTHEYRDSPADRPRLADRSHADAVARLLWDFNREFDVDSPPVGTLSDRLAELLDSSAMFAVVAGAAPVAVALITFRPSVWYPGPVATLDEMYVVPALRGQGIGSRVLTRAVAECRSRKVGSIEINVDESDTDALRFYRRHGFTDVDPSTDERAFYLFQDLV